MVDFLDVLAKSAADRVKKGYYNIEKHSQTPATSLKKRILESKHIPIIVEIKTASPSLGKIRKTIDVRNIALAIEDAGGVGISVLTEPKYFGGSLAFLTEVKSAVKLPLLMKDIIVSTIQLDAASKTGANAVLLIEPLFDRGYCECGVHDMIERAQSMSLEVLLEIHSKEEFVLALDTNADLIGINNRDLKTLKVDLGTTKTILRDYDFAGKVIVSESGVKTSADIRFLKDSGVHAFLIGTSIMTANSVENKIKEFVFAL